MTEARRYRFGPLERRGVLMGLRASQLVVVGLAGLFAVAAVRAFSPGLVLASLFFICVTGIFAAFVPVGGRCLDEWLPVLVSWAGSGLAARRRFVSAQAVTGWTVRLDPQPVFPPSLKSISILAHRFPGAESSIGVVKDSRAGTFTGILSVRGRSFALLDAPDKARRLGAWAGILSGLAREGGAVHRIQWVERTVPDSGDEIGNYLKENLAVSLDSAIARSYLEVVDEAGPVTQQHEMFVALQVHAGRSGRAVKNAGGGDYGACEVLRRELVALATKLASADITVDGALTPRLVARALRTAFDPSCRDSLARMAARHPSRVGTAIVNAAPLAAEATWSSYRTEAACHATYWIAEWPRIEADADFLAPLLLRTERMRTVSLTMEPVAPSRALRTVESARTSAAADEELRHRAGFMATARRSREQEALASHEQDLSDGHAFYRFAGFVTATAGDPDELEATCAEIEDAASRCFLDLRRLYGQQDEAFTYTLPLCRGLK